MTSYEMGRILTQLKKQHLLSDDEALKLTEHINRLNKRAYQKCAARYAKHRPLLTEPQKKYLDTTFNYIANTFQSGSLKIMDIGCGHGLSLDYLNTFERIECHAVETSKEFIELLPKNIKCTHCDMSALQLESNAYQAVLHHGTLHHLPWFTENHLGISKALSEAVRVLAPHGLLSIIVKHQEEDFFDETGRFFSSMNEDIMRELLMRENVSIYTIKTIHNQKARTGWQNWVLVQAIKKGED